VGHISLGQLNWDNRTGRISRVLVGSPALRGQGYGQAMVNALLNIGFTELGLQRITLGVYDFNTPAIRCYHRCGFQHIGTLRHVVRYDNEYWSSVEMCLQKDEWRLARAA
jgi:RimJ/RimL family protein N-acetyltransferase